MRILLITVAGKSTRFSKSINKSVLKCIYSNDGDLKKTILYKMLKMGCDYDRFIIVGGYRFNELTEAINKMSEFSDKIDLVYNEMFDFGSGYSLKKGLEKALEIGFDELTFAEGDLWIRPCDFDKILKTSADVITFNREPILANKSVIAYTTPDDKLHYLYDTNHDALVINCPFTAIYNSGQIWKFTKYEKVKKTFNSIDEKNWMGTNLVFIQAYFDNMNIWNVNVIGFSDWINCNTIEDYNKIEGLENEGH